MAHLSLIALFALVVVAAIGAEDPPECPLDQSFTDQQCTGAEEEGLDCTTEKGGPVIPTCSCKNPRKCTKSKLEGGSCKFMCQTEAFREAVSDELKTFDMGVYMNKKKK